MPNPENLYLVGGRLEGQDDDSVYVVASNTGLGEAKQIFTHKLLENYESDEGEGEADNLRESGVTVYLSYALPLADLIESPLTTPGADALSVLDAEDDRVVRPGW